MVVFHFECFQMELLQMPKHQIISAKLSITTSQKMNKL